MENKYEIIRDKVMVGTIRANKKLNAVADFLLEKYGEKKEETSTPKDSVTAFLVK